MYKNIDIYCSKCRKGKQILLLKEVSFVANFNCSATRCRRSLTFQTMNSVRSNSLSLKYLRFTPYGCKKRKELKGVTGYAR